MVDDDELRAFVEWHVERLEEQVDAESARSQFGLVPPMLHTDRRSRETFLSSVDEWAAEALEEPTVGLHDLAAQMSRAFAVKIVNNTTASLKDVRLDITFDAPLTALDWQDEAATDARVFEVESPSLVIVGSKDPDFKVPANEIEYAKNSFQGRVEGLLVDGAGHYPHVERPDVVSPRVIEFLETLWRAPA